MSVGLFLSSYAPSLLFLYISYGLLLGIGTSLCGTMALIVTADYFDKHLSLATGIVASGSSFGTLALSPTLQVLVEFRLATTFRIMGLGGIMMAIAGLVYKRVNRNPIHMPPETRPVFRHVGFEEQGIRYVDNSYYSGWVWLFHTSLLFGM